MEAHSFLLVECAHIKHAMIYEKEAHLYNAWILLLIWDGTVFQKRCTTLFHLKPGDCCTDSGMQKGSNPLFVWGLQWMWMWIVFIITDNCCVPLFHYFAFNLHNRLNCLGDGISMSRILSSYSMAYRNLMAVILIETDQNSFCLSCKTLKFVGWVSTPLLHNTIVFRYTSIE